MLAPSARHFLSARPVSSATTATSPSLLSPPSRDRRDDTSDDSDSDSMYRASVAEFEVSSSDEAEEIMAPSTRGVLARLSFISRPQEHAGAGTSQTMAMLVASQISGFIVANWLLVHTDHVMILVTLLIETALTLKVVRDVVYAWSASQRLGIDRWATVTIYALDFIFHMTFFSASMIAAQTVMASALFAAGEGHAVAYLAALVVALVQILLFIGHASFGALAHADEWVKRPLAPDR